MNPSDDTNTIFLSNPAGLARILAQDQTDAPVWSEEELRAMWQHQLRTPVEADLSTVQSASAASYRSALQSAPSQTFAQLLHHTSPALPLLKLTKEFAKQTLKDCEDAQLKEIAAMLYYASYASAIATTAQRLGGMSDHELRGGFDWSISRSWLDERTRQLISAARATLH